MTVAPPDATLRDRAANALVLGFAGIMWLMWAQAAPPPSWTPFLLAGAVAGAVVAVTAAVLAWRHRAGASAMGNGRGRTAYRWAVGTEVALIAVGAAVLGATGRADYLSPWVLFVVGAHFLPLSTVFRIDSLRLCGLVAMAVAAVAAFAGLAGAVQPGAVAGGGGGLLMVAFGGHSLRSTWRGQVPRPARRSREVAR